MCVYIYWIDFSVTSYRKIHICECVCEYIFFPTDLFSYKENTCLQFCFTSQHMNTQKQKAPWRRYTLKQENL